MRISSANCLLNLVTADASGSEWLLTLSSSITVLTIAGN